MATSPQALPLSRDSQTAVLKYSENIFAMLHHNYDFRTRLLEQDRIYQREVDLTKAEQRGKAANWVGDTSKMRNVTLPVVGPQVDSATAYFVEMFLHNYPIFPVVVPPKFADVGLQLETILGQSAQYYQWGRHLAMCFRDGFKHNLMAVELDWYSEKIYSVVNDPQQSMTSGTPQETLFSGNRMKRIDLYNLIFDKRVAPAECHKRGEFVGYSELITRIELKQMLLDLDRSLTMNATEAFESGTAATTGDLSQTSTYYVPQVNPAAFMQNSYTAHNWLQWANLDTKKKIHYSDMYELTTLYCRVIPKELKIFTRAGNRSAGEPQIYKFLIVNRKVVVYAQRMTNAHNMLPIVIGQLNEDGLRLQTKSYAENAAPYQFLASSLYNSAIESQRRKVYDRIIYDPSRINKADIDRVDPVARIPVKAEAYGKPIGEAVLPLPYRDEGIASILAVAREVVDMSDVATGQNRVQRGQFQKGNKTRYEFDTVMSNSDARPKTSAILMGISWLQPIKEILKYNILQYQPPANLFNTQAQQQVEVKPQDIRAVSWDFQLADGSMPSDKYLNYELFGQVLQYASAVPTMAAEWDLAGMFAYQLKMQGARWVDDFRRTPEQMQQAQAQIQAANNPPQPQGLPQ